MNRSVLVSSKVLFAPSRAATSACTSSFGCSARALKPSSLLANANATLPVVGLILVGGRTPKAASFSANFWLLINVSRSDIAFSISASLRCLTSPKCCSSRGKFNCNTGSVNIFKVRSINLSSLSL